MLRKTYKKLQRRFERLPLHHIDTDILIEALKETKLGNQCSDYLNRIGYKYRGVLSLSIIGEFFLVTFRDVKEQSIRDSGFEFIDRFIRRKKVGFSSLKYENFRIIDKIKEIDSRIEDTDAVHLANCIQDKGDIFVTFDEKLVENSRLGKEFNMKLIHPESL